MSSTFVRLKRVFLRLNSGGTVYGAGRLNVIAGSNCTLSAAEDSTNEEIDLTINAAGPLTCEAHTADDTLLAAETGSVHTNDGASGAVILTLPAAAAGLVLHFKVMEAQALRVKAATGDTIQMGTGAAGSAGGYVEADLGGESISLIALNATEWHTFPGTAAVGTWTAG